MANGIFSHDTILRKDRCAKEFLQNHSDKAAQTRFHSDSLLHYTRMWCFLSEALYQTFSGIKIYDCLILPRGYPAVALSNGIRLYAHLYARQHELRICAA